MSVGGVSSSLAGQILSTQRAQQAASMPADDPAGPIANSAQTPARPLSGINVVSRVQTTLPNGTSLSVFRFDLGTSGSSPTGLPTEFEKRNDRTMLNALKQMAASYNYLPDPDDIKFEGTAAIDRCV